MLLRLFILILILPIAELVVLLWVVQSIGWLKTLALVVLMAILGTYEIQRQGSQIWTRMGEQLDRGELPGNELLDGFLLFIAGILLLIPGLITDAVGLVLIVPPTRYLVREGVKKWLKRRLEQIAESDDGWVRVQMLADYQGEEEVDPDTQEMVIDLPLLEAYDTESADQESEGQAPNNSQQS